jgi:hypothetical protein
VISARLSLSTVCSVARIIGAKRPRQRFAGRLNNASGAFAANHARYDASWSVDFIEYSSALQDNKVRLSIRKHLK